MEHIAYILVSVQIKSTAKLANLTNVASIIGSGEQQEQVTWWPSHTRWADAAQNMGAWTKWNQDWFKQREEAILDEKKGGIPRQASKWRSTLRGKEEPRRITANIADKALTYLREYVMLASAD